MNKDKWKDISGNLLRQLHFLRIEEDPEQEDEIQVEERPLSSGNISKKDLPEGDLKEKLERNRRWVFRRRIVLLVLAVLTIGGFVLYNRMYTFTDYVIVDSYENEVASGSKYEAVGKNIYRYNSDGVSCVSRKNELKWSITYNMQAPIADVCGETMAVAEQQGNQVYVVNKDGLVGNFETLLPILKVRVSKQGVVAVVLQEENVTWVNLYQSDGTSIANDKTTVAESGYPLDIDLSPDGQKLAVSYLGIREGIINSRVVFYHFGAAGQSADNHIVNSESYTETVIPEVYFTDNSRAVAVADNGFMVFKGSDVPKQSASVAFEEEIVSTFHDESRIGFLFRSTDEKYPYRMELYSYSGRKKASREMDAEFDKIKIQNGQILMYSDNHCDIFLSSGRKRFSSAYEKEIVDVFYFSEFRKYMVITQDSFDRIKVS
ncbi:MAG: DUF5711 family protein [Lachnospiraceae bacterium]|nr:DUF5711 family protein [Lachnospiraceae bacterium]